MAGQLFLRSYERSDRVHHAMLARGYVGEVRTLNPHRMRRGTGSPGRSQCWSCSCCRLSVASGRPN
ncbi:MAG: energy-coupling factor transporter transmembrane component T [Chloroflexia bacterium]